MGAALALLPVSVLRTAAFAALAAVVPTDLAAALFCAVTFPDVFRWPVADGVAAADLAERAGLPVTGAL
ncbi:hypothetical protein PATSB16_09200 [Pandoraea thiooxydans]|nr:hypothetical protein PATSB16_09200 [Pandoraea thiooxydans]